jgi:hypothetical protein
MADTSELAALLQDYVPRSDYEAALEAVDGAVREREEHRAAADKHTGRLAELEKKLRGRTWRDKFRELAKGKVKADHEDDVYELLKLQEDADEPDAKALGKQLDDFLEKRGAYKAAKADGRSKEIPAGEGSGRGRSVAPGQPEFRVTPKERGDALWMRENQARFNQAAKDGTLVMDDD